MRDTGRIHLVLGLLLALTVGCAQAPQATPPAEKATATPTTPSEPTATPTAGEQMAGAATPTPIPPTPTSAKSTQEVERRSGRSVTDREPNAATQSERTGGEIKDDAETAAHRFEGPEVTLVVSSPVVNLRQGPGTGYKVIGQATAGTELVPLGRTEDSSWFEARYEKETAWVAASVVKPVGDLKSLPKVDARIVHAATPTPAPTPTPEPLQPRQCQEVPIRGFGKVWADHIAIQHWLGCPGHEEQGTRAAVQRFQHGVMVWVEQDSVERADPVYVFFEDGTYQRFGTVRLADPAKVGETPPGFYAVGDKFGAAYWEGTGARVKERLGYAVTEQVESAGAFQQFWYGRMFWLGTIDSIFVLDNYPHVWQGFEDTF